MNLCTLKFNDVLGFVLGAMCIQKDIFAKKSFKAKVKSVEIYRFFNNLKPVSPAFRSFKDRLMAVNHDESGHKEQTDKKESPLKRYCRGDRAD